MDNSVGVNRRFIDERLFVDKNLNTEGFGAGAAGKQKALEAALNTEGSELIYQDAAGQWFAQEIGEAKGEEDQHSALSKIDRDHIKLHPTLSTRQGMHNAFISFKDDRAAFKAPDQLDSLSSWQKLKIGNKHAVQEIASQGVVILTNPFSAATDMATGMVVNTWKTLSNPMQTFETVGATYRQDKIEGVLEGAKIAGSVVASAALVIGVGVAVGNTGVKLGSLRTGKHLQGALEAVASAQYEPLMSRTVQLAKAGRTLGQIGKVTGQLGKAASLTMLGATSLSLLKNEWELARAITPEKMTAEVQQITQDASSLAQSAAMYAANKILGQLAEKTKQLYTENRNYQSISPESQAVMDQLIDQQSQLIAERVKNEVPEFKPETWGGISEADKMVALNKINAIFVEQMSLKPQVGELGEISFKAPEILLKDLPESKMGYYSPQDKTITINRSQLGSATDMGRTLTHEGFHAFQMHMIDILRHVDQASFGEAIDQHLNAWVDNTFVTGYASPEKNINQSVLGVSVKHLPTLTDISPVIIEGALFPGLDSYSEYKTQPLEAGAWRMGNKFADAYQQLNPLAKSP